MTPDTTRPAPSSASSSRSSSCRLFPLLPADSKGRNQILRNEKSLVEQSHRCRRVAAQVIVFVAVRVFGERNVRAHEARAMLGKSYRRIAKVPAGVRRQGNGNARLTNAGDLVA